MASVVAFVFVRQENLVGKYPVHLVGKYPVHLVGKYSVHLVGKHPVHLVGKHPFHEEVVLPSVVSCCNTRLSSF